MSNNSPNDNGKSISSNNDSRTNLQLFDAIGNGGAGNDFGNWQDADFKSFLSDPNLGSVGFLSGPSPAPGSSSINNDTGSRNDTPNSSAKYYGPDSQTSPASSMKLPAEFLYYQQNAGPNNGNNPSPAGLQIPPRFQAAIAAAAQANSQNNGNMNQNFSPSFDNQPALDTTQTSEQTGKPTKGKKKDAAANKKDNTQNRVKMRPCDHCRRRKTKCVVKPDTNGCQQCESKGLRCTYSDAKRLSSDDTSDVAQKKGKYIVDELHPPPTIPVREVDPVQDYSSMPGYSLLKKTLSLQYPRSSFYIGPSSVYDPLLLNRIQLDKIDQVQLNQTTSLRKVAPNVQFTLKDDYTEQLYESTERNVDAVERFVAPHGKVLIELYFRIVHPSFPVLHKKVFLEKYSRTHREFSAPLLAAVYSLAIQWWDYDPQLSQFPKPNVVALLKLAMKTFSFVIERPKLSAVQAGLLLLQCRGDNSSNWSLCSQVVALAEELGLGLDCADWRLPKWERGLRRRLAWAVYLQDKWLALIESRPSHIVEDRNWSVKHVTDEDFPEKSNEPDSSKEGSTDIENGKALFKQMISLSQILSEILDSLFSMSAMENLVRIDQVLKAAKPLQLKLRQWYHSLPAELQMSSIQPRKLNSNGYLQLAYFAAEITLHRKIITTLTPDTPFELVQVCRTAARTRLLAALEFVRSLKPEHIHSFWHSSATANFTLIGTFAAILFVTSPTAEEASQYKDHVYNYRWILRVSAKGFDQAASALEKLDTILFHIPGLFKDTTELNNMTPNNDDEREYSSTPPQDSQQPQSTGPATQQSQAQNSQRQGAPRSPQNQQLQQVKNEFQQEKQQYNMQQQTGINDYNHSRSNSRSSNNAQTSKNSPFTQPYSPYNQMQQQYPGTQHMTSKPNTPIGMPSPVVQQHSPANAKNSPNSAALSPHQTVQRTQSHLQNGSSHGSPMEFNYNPDQEGGTSPASRKKNSVTSAQPSETSPLANSRMAASSQNSGGGEAHESLFAKRD